MDEREYVEALIAGMQQFMREAEAQARSLATPLMAREFMEEQRQRGLAFMDSLVPPEPLKPLHDRMRARSERRARDEDDDQLVDDVIELARLAQRYGLELAPGMDLAAVEAAARSGAFSGYVLVGDLGEENWESRLRRALAEDGHPDPEAIVARMRQLRER